MIGAEATAAAADRVHATSAAMNTSTKLSQATQEKDAQPDTFHKFPKLPQELQDRVWMFACAVEKVVEVRFSEDADDPKNTFVASVPTLLHTCRDSRCEGLRYYRKIDSEETTRPAYFNPEADVLYLRIADDNKLLHSLGLGYHNVPRAVTGIQEAIAVFPFKDSVRKLAIPYYGMSDIPAASRLVRPRMPIILQFAKLDEVRLVHEFTLNGSSPKADEHESRENCDCCTESTRQYPVGPRSTVLLSASRAEFHQENHALSRLDVSRNHAELIHGFIEYFKKALKGRDFGDRGRPSFTIAGVIHEKSYKDLHKAKMGRQGRGCRTN